MVFESEFELFKIRFGGWAIYLAGAVLQKRAKTPAQSFGYSPICSEIKNIDMKSPRDEQNEGDSQPIFCFLGGQAKCQYQVFHFQASETVRIASAQDFS